MITGLTDLLFPLHCFHVKQQCLPWSYSPEARSVRRTHDKAHRRAIHLNTPSAWAEYRQARNKCNSVLRSKYFTTLAENLKSDPIKFWRHICTSHLSHSKGSKKPTQFSHSSDDFNNHYCDIPHRIYSFQFG